MKTLMAFAACIGIGLLHSETNAQLRPGQPQGFVTLTARVTGGTGAGIFVIAAPQGRITVDAAGAAIRGQNQLATVTSIRPGALVRVSGTLTGSRLVAQTVDILSLPGDNRSSTARSSAKPNRIRRHVTRPRTTIRTRVIPGQRTPLVAPRPTRTQTQTIVVPPPVRQTAPPRTTVPRK
jgi:hypothetical protein